jgi:thioredoxin-dependent peroxiredoxin
MPTASMQRSGLGNGSAVPPHAARGHNLITVLGLSCFLRFLDNPGGNRHLDVVSARDSIRLPFFCCRRVAMALRINSDAPNFTAETTQGPITFHDWIGSSWAILFSHPKDFTPVCTTELGYMAGLKPEFDKRNCKILGLSVDPVTNHAKWAKDIEETQGHAVNYPMVGDPELKVAKLYDMLPEDAAGSAEKRTPADNATVRSVFVIGPDKKVKAMLTYPMSTGRNFDEVLRLLDSCQLTAKHTVATPVNWKQGQDVIIPPAVSDEQAKAKYPKGWKTLKPYLRIIPQPKD